jgi:sugar/nucleoside kinase (ribokinase family)
MRKIIGMGNALVDVLVKLPDENVLSDLGLEKGSMRLVDLAFSNRVLEKVWHFDRQVMCGGSASNTVSGLAKLGLDCTFIGKISDDEMGENFKADLDRNNIRHQLFIDDPQTGRAVALITPDSERTFATYLGSAVKLSPQEINAEIFNGFDFFHVEGYLVQNHDLIEKALATAKGMGLKTSIDLASFNVVAENLEFLKNIVKRYVDIVFANEEEALAFTGLDPESSVREIARNCEIAIVKTGPRGSLVSCQESVCKIDAIKAEPIDTTGAGDLYAAGFLYGLMKDMNLNKAAEIGSLLAGNVIEHVGARIPEAKWPELIKKIQLL